ncbi:MAG: acyl-CoA dehydrogenase family protein [Geminicoccales bacterium]
MAKCVVTPTAIKAAKDALQFRRGYGYLVDIGIDKIAHDLRVHQIQEGTNQIMWAIIAPNLIVETY